MATRVASSSTLGRAAMWLPLVVLLAAAFGPTLLWMLRIWQRSEYYGHGLIVAPVAAFIAWKLVRRGIRTGGPTWPGLAMIVAGLGIHLVACHLAINFPSAFAFVLVLAGTVAWLWGWAALIQLWFPFAYFALAVPMERLLVDQFAQPLQLASSTLAASLARGAGIPVLQRGNILMLPGYTVEVAIPCSGLRSAIAMLAIAALAAYLLEGAVWKRWLLVALAIPLAFASNVVRLLTVMVLARAVSPSLAEGFFHTGSGLMVFAVATSALLAIAWVLGCRTLRADIW